MRCAPRVSNGPNHLGLCALQDLAEAEVSGRAAAGDDARSAGAEHHGEHPAFLHESQHFRAMRLIFSGLMASWVCFSSPMTTSSATTVRGPTAWAVTRHDGPNHLGL